MAIMITTMLSTLSHCSVGGYTKPLIETFSAIVAGLIFGFVAIRTKSIWYSFLMHATVGFATDLFITLFVHLK